MVFSKVSLVIAFVAIVSAYDVDPADAPAIDERIIKYINNAEGATWVAGTNEFFEGKSMDDARRLMGWKVNPNKKPLPVVKDVMADLPLNFSSAVQWPHCTTIGTIYNQADCGSCWAFGCVEAVSDRFCIHKGSNYNQILSFLEQTSCNEDCSGCNGGDPDDAWNFVAESGLVTDECYPYTIPSCPPEQQPCLNFTTTPDCQSSCSSSSEKWLPYNISAAYDINADQNAIMTDIYKNGPVEACFTVYADFVHYKSGVYQYKTGEALGGHCIKIIGWGVENGTPYWECNNSWTTYWGNQGQFRILRGKDECGIEDEVVAGTI